MGHHTKIIIELCRLNGQFYSNVGEIFKRYLPEMKEDSAKEKLQEEILFCEGLTEYFKRPESMAFYGKVAKEIENDTEIFSGFLNKITPGKPDRLKIRKMMSEIKKTKDYHVPLITDLQHQLFIT